MTHLFEPAIAADVPPRDPDAGAAARRDEGSDTPPFPRLRPGSPAAVLARTIEPRGAEEGAGPVAILLRALDRWTPSRAGTSAFWTLWLAYRDELRRQSLRFSSGNFADAEDALSEAMLKAVQAFPRAEIRNPRAWLLRLVHNSCIDRHREHRRRHEAMQVHAGDDGQSIPAAAPRPARTPEDLLAARQQIGDLDRALSALPPPLAEPLRLHLDDLSDAEIAARLGITREVVRKRRQMARAWLRRQIA